MHRPRIEHLPEMGHRRLVDVSPVWVDLCHTKRKGNRMSVYAQGRVSQGRKDAWMDEEDEP